MNQDDFFELGYISRLHGYKGAVVIKMDTAHPERYTMLKEMWIKKNAAPERYVIESISVHQKEALVKIQSVNNAETASALLRKSVYLPLSMLPPLSGKSFYFHEIRGFSVEDHTYGNIGKIETVYDLPQHPVAGILMQGKEILIPLVPDFIESIDRKNKIIMTCLPEGMIEVYHDKTGDEE